MFDGEALKHYCSKPMNKRCIDILEDMGAIGCVYYDDRSELVAVYSAEKATRVEFEFGAETREKFLFYSLGFLSAIAVWICTEYLIPWVVSLL